MADDIALEGKTTVDDKMVFEPQRLSYEASRSIAEKIARRISGRTRDRHVVIAGMQLLADFSNVVATKTELEELAGEYKTLAAAVNNSTPVVPYSFLAPERSTEYARFVAPAFETVTAGVKGALTLLSFFRQDVDYKGVPVSIDSLGFEIELAARIRMHKAHEVLIPDLATFRVSESGASALRASIERVKAARAACIQAVVAKMPKPTKQWRPFKHLLTEEERNVRELDDVDRGGDVEQAAVEKAPEADEATKSEAPSVPSLANIEGVFTQIDQRFDALQSQLSKPDTDGSGLTIFARLLRAESIGARSPMLVHVRVLTAGGSNRVSRSLFRTMLTGDGLSSSGGAVVSWAILSEHGAIEDGGIITESMSASSPKPPDTPHTIP